MIFPKKVRGIKMGKNPEGGEIPVTVNIAYQPVGRLHDQKKHQIQSPQRA
jgi:hypothetical protein